LLTTSVSQQSLSIH